MEFYRTLTEIEFRELNIKKPRTHNKKLVTVLVDLVIKFVLLTQPQHKFSTVIANANEVNDRH